MLDLKFRFYVKFHPPKALFNWLDKPTYGIFPASFLILFDFQVLKTILSGKRIIYSAIFTGFERVNLVHVRDCFGEVSGGKLEENYPEHIRQNPENSIRCCEILINIVFCLAVRAHYCLGNRWRYPGLLQSRSKRLQHRAALHHDCYGRRKIITLI